MWTTEWSLGRHAGEETRRRADAQNGCMGSLVSCSCKRGHDKAVPCAMIESVKACWIPNILAGLWRARHPLHTQRVFYVQHCVAFHDLWPISGSRGLNCIRGLEIDVAGVCPLLYSNSPTLTRAARCATNERSEVTMGNLLHDPSACACASACASVLKRSRLFVHVVHVLHVVVM